MQLSPSETTPIAADVKAAAQLTTLAAPVLPHPPPYPSRSHCSARWSDALCRACRAVRCTEYRTSKLCSTCHYPLEQDVHVRRLKAGSTTNPPSGAVGHQALRQPQLPRELHRPRRERVPQHAGRRRAAALLAPEVGAPRGPSRLPAQLGAARDASRRAQGEPAAEGTQGSAGQPGHAHQRRVRRGGVGSSSAELLLQQQLQPLIRVIWRTQRENASPGKV